MSDAEDIMIARVVLAGWRIVPLDRSHLHVQYKLIDPSGLLRSVHATRYTAALRAEDLAEQWMRP